MAPDDAFCSGSVRVAAASDGKFFRVAASWARPHGEFFSGSGQHADAADIAQIRIAARADSHRQLLGGELFGRDWGACAAARGATEILLIVGAEGAVVLDDGEDRFAVAAAGAGGESGCCDGIVIVGVRETVRWGQGASSRTENARPSPTVARDGGVEESGANRGKHHVDVG